jgi:acetyl esterase/lipase
MSHLEVAKVHPKLGELLEEDFKLSSKAGNKFAKEKSVPLEDLTSFKADWDLLLEYNRYIDTAKALEASKNIPEETIFEPINAGGVHSEWIYLPEASKERIFFHLWGGGYIMGSLLTRRWEPYLYSKTMNKHVLNVGYRLAPEHPYPAALDDSIKAYKWLLETDIDPKNIIICGESAGGGLTISTLLKLRELDIALPAAAIVLSPWVDLRAKSKSLKKFAKFEPELAIGVKVMSRLYADKESLKNPFISPVYAELYDLPPLLIQAGGIEVLRDESILLAERAKEAGVEVTLEVYEEMTHVFQRFYNELDESMQAWDSIKKFSEKYVS